MEAEVVSIKNSLVHLKVDWNTWQAAAQSDTFLIHGKAVISVQFHADHVSVVRRMPQESLLDALGAAIASTAENRPHVHSE